ncbi:sterol desaturase family protein [uncultured Winogradskyella sp.]|uniref:sterol desaturase family protein n=1 Tax=uncultured Winogradskyella sp. TaxID=395353 RepID=UPI0035178753
MAAITTYVAISVIIFIYGLLEIDQQIVSKVGLLIFGLLVFTLVEYLFHRFVYHSGKDYLEEGNWQYKVHGVHHEHPTDKDLLAMPIPLAIMLSTIFFGIFWLIMGINTFFFWPGFFIGYAGYLYVHYIVHTRKPPNNAFNILWSHHHLHHYVYDNKAYGVSSPLWDIIFGTMPPKNEPLPRQKRRRPSKN